MKSIYVRNLFGSYLKKKKMIVICLIIFILAFGCLGIRQAYPEKVSSSLAEEVAEYEEALQNYDDAIANIEENIEVMQDEVDDQQTYCDESIYMQIDPSDVKVVSVQYMIKISDMSAQTVSTQISYFLNAWTTYITSGSMKSGVAAELEDVPTEYLSEILSTSTAGNTFTITVKHYDMDQAKAIMEILQERIEEHKSEVAESLGEFEMSVTASSEVSVGDVNIQNNQNNNLNNLRSYKNTLADYKTKLVTKQTEKSNYEQQYKPTGVSTGNPKKTLLEYGALGILAGILVPFIIFALYYTISGRVKGQEDILAAGLTVLAAYHSKEGFSPSANRAVMDISLLAKQKGAQALYLNILGAGPLLDQVEGEISSLLERRKVKTVSVTAGEETPEQLQDMAEAGNSVLFIEAGNTTYSQVEEQMQFCRRFDISVWGCIVIE